MLWELLLLRRPETTPRRLQNPRTCRRPSQNQLFGWVPSQNQFLAQSGHLDNVHLKTMLVHLLAKIDWEWTRSWFYPIPAMQTIISSGCFRIRLVGRVPHELCSGAQPGRDLSPHFGQRGQFWPAGAWTFYNVHLIDPEIDDIIVSVKKSRTRALPHSGMAPVQNRVNE